MMRGRKRRSPPQVSGGDGAAIDGKGETTEVDDTTPQDDMQDRAELIPPDLAPRITQMVVDDLRAAGWILISPVDLDMMSTPHRWALQGILSPEPHVHTWAPINIIGRAQESCYGCDAVRDVPVAKPCTHPRTRRSASFDGHLICLSCGEDLDLSGS
jgi:hypothetical protein